MVDTTFLHCSEGTLGNLWHTKRALGLPGTFTVGLPGKLPTSKGVPSVLWYVSTYRTSHLPGKIPTIPDVCQGFLIPRVYQTSNVVSSPDLVPCFYQGFSFLTLVLPGFSFFTSPLPELPISNQPFTRSLSIVMVVGISIEFHSLISSD